MNHVKRLLILLLTLVFVLFLAASASAGPKANSDKGNKNKVKAVGVETQDVEVTEEEVLEGDPADEEEGEDEVMDPAKAQEKLQHHARIRTGQAVKAVEQYLKHDPDNTEALEMLNELLGTTEEEQEADGTEVMVQEAGDTEDPAAVYGRLGQLYKKMNKYREAVQALEEGVSLDPEATALYDELAEVYEASGEKGFKVFVNGRRPFMDQPPVIKHGRVLVPVRAVTTALGASVGYDMETQTITIEKDGATVELQLDSMTAVVNGETVTLDSPAASVNARTVVPLRFIAEALGIAVEYDDDSDIIVVNEGGEDEELEINE